MCVVRVYKLVIVALTMIVVSNSQNCSLPTHEDLKNVIKLIITYAEETPAIPTVDVTDFHVVCLAFSDSRDLYRSVSVVVQYTCVGNSNCPMGEVVEQIECECKNQEWSTVSTAQDGVEQSRLQDPLANLTTPAREDCAFCFSPVLAVRLSLSTDEVTHCVACDWSCNRGHGRCIGLAPSVCHQESTSSSCCNYYHESTFVDNCPSPYTVDGDNNCVCPAGTTGDNCGEDIDCGCLSNPENGAVQWNDTTYNSVATYTCNTGYDLEGGRTRMCSESGTWSDSEPVCNVVTCDDLDDPGHGAVSYTATVYDSVASYSCDVGYSLSGDDERRCLQSGKWSGTAPSCSVVDCGELSLANGEVSYSFNTAYNSVATYSCNDSYRLVGTNTRTCSASGDWSGSAPTCSVVDCGELSVTNGRVFYSHCTAYNSVATYSCNAGYDLIGANTRTCSASGDWSGSPPTCSVVDCGELSLASGEVSYSFNTVYDSVATYSCNDSYNLVGTNTRTCLASGDWSGSPPTCSAIDCGCLQIGNGSVSVDSTTVNSVATYHCNTGYDLVGTKTRTCMASGTWSGIEPTCSKDNGDTQSMQCQADAVGGALGAILGIVIIALIVSIGFNIKCFMTKNGRVHSTPTKKITVKKAQGTS